MDRKWQDTESGREYLLLSSRGSWSDNEKKCLEQGMVPSDLRFLTDGERLRFLRSSELDALHWEEKSTGSLNFLWQSADEGLQFSVLISFRKNGKTYHTVELKDPHEFQANTICMSVPAFWFRCSVRYHCQRPEGVSKFYLADYGSTQNEAIQRLVERTQSPKYSVNEGKCGIQTELTYCHRVLPQ